MSPKPIIIAVILLFCCSPAISQQHGVMTEGRDFYFAVLPSASECLPKPEITLLVSTAESTSLALTMLDSLGAETRLYSVVATHGLRIPLSHLFDGQPALSRSGEVAEYRSYHLTASSPVALQYLSTGFEATTMYTVLPVSALGSHYVIPSYNSNTGQGQGSPTATGCPIRDSGSSCFMIVAPFDGTTVTIIPNATTALHHHQGVTSGSHSDRSVHPFSVQLSRGEIYWVRSETTEFPADMSGSKVDANKPIAVVAGNDDAVVDTLAGALLTSPGIPSRNMMLQQVIPSEYLAAGDHLSMPLVDFAPFDSIGHIGGEFYRAFTTDSTPTTIEVYEQGGPRKAQVLEQYLLSPAIANVTTGMDVSSDVPISVEQYDYRQQGVAGSTAPTMLNVLATSQWKNAYVFSSELSGVNPQNFLNVIASRNTFATMVVQKDGGSFVPIRSLTSYGDSATFSGFVDSSNEVGKRFVIPRGTYVIKADSTFAAYLYGVGRYKYQPNLNNEIAEEFASTVGEQFFARQLGEIICSVTNDSCRGWVITATESDPMNMGFSSIELLHDTIGLRSSPPRVSDNVGIDSDRSFLQTRTSIHVNVVDPFNAAYAAVRIVSRTGKDTIVELQRPLILVGTTATTIDLHAMVGYDTCSMVTMYNRSPSTMAPFKFIAAAFPSADSSIKLVSTVPALPAHFNAGDSLQIRYCFQPRDTLQEQVRLQLIGDCQTMQVPVRLQSTTPLIFAGNADMGYISVGTEQCHMLEISNEGSAPLVILAAERSDSSVRVQSPPFPITLLPDSTTFVRICRSATRNGYDSSRIIWVTNQTGKFNHSIRDTSWIYGRGVSSVPLEARLSNLMIRPNPLHGEVVTVGGTLVESGGTLQIFDVLGNPVRKFPPQFTKERSISLTGIASGTYYLRAENRAQVMTVKISIVR